MRATQEVAATSAKDDDDKIMATNILESTGSILNAAVEDLTKNLGILVMKYPSILQEDEMKEIQSTLLPGLSFLSDSMNHLADMQKHQRQLAGGIQQQQQPQRQQQELQDVVAEHPDNSRGPGDVTTGKQQQTQQLEQRDLSNLAYMQQHKRQLTGGIQQQPQGQEQQLQDVNTITGSGGVTEKQQQQLDQHLQNDCLFNHPTNKKFRKVIEENMALYAKLSPSQKSKMATQIVQSWRSGGGRFLKRNEDTGEWEDVGDDNARVKVLRDLRRHYVKSLSGGQSAERFSFAGQS